MVHRTLSDKSRDWLLAEMSRWQSEGLLSGEQAGRILQLYETPAEAAQRKHSLALFLLTAIAACLVALGILLLVGYHWEAMAREAKLAVVFGVLLSTYGLGYYLRYRRQARLAAELVFFVACTFYGCGAWLIAEMLHVQTNYPDGLWVWALGVLPIALGLDTFFLHALLVGLLAAWVATDRFDFGFPRRPPLFGAWLIETLGRMECPEVLLMAPGWRASSVQAGPVADDPHEEERMEHLLRQLLLRLLTGERELVFTRAVTSREQLRAKLAKISELGLYLHVPFCEQICPYCPYNKELYRSDLARRYVDGVKTEMDSYAELLGDKPITSLYIGGGTPTAMLPSGLGEIIGHMQDVFRLQCDIHMESHPNHLSAGNLSLLKSLGVQHLSLGGESLFDRHLQFLGRPYTAAGVKEAIRRAVSAGFKCVNADVMFALPGQTYREIEETGRELVALGIDQVAAYPLFHFPYTPLVKAGTCRNHLLFESLKRRKMLRILERIFYRAGYERTSVWAFTRRGVPRYCSVTVPLYLGLGASGGSYLQDVFYVNTFGVAEYIRAIEERGTAAALSVELTDRMQRAGWLYWRIYETRFAKADYRQRFGEDLEQAYGGYLRALKLFGLLRDDGERITLSDRGSFWLHACEDILSIDYISNLWGTAKHDLWPDKVIL